jgi:hypothetical protein
LGDAYSSELFGGMATLPTKLTTFVGGMGVLLGGMGIFLGGTRPFHSTKQLERELIGIKASSCLGFSPNLNGFPFSHIYIYMHMTYTHTHTYSLGQIVVTSLAFSTYLNCLGHYVSHILMN